MAFDGTLIKLGGNTNLPLSYVKPESYTVVPNRRQDLDSTRTTSGHLQRNVVEHYASTITLETVENMTNAQMSALMSLIRSKYSSEREKKITLRYYVPDLDTYQTGTFYVPDVEFPIKRVDVPNRKIYYNPVTIEFIEY